MPNRPAMRRISVTAIVLATCVVPIASTSADRASASDAGCAVRQATYSVRSGDGWLAIARRFEVPPGDLLASNAASLDDLLVTGRILCLPDDADPTLGCTSTYVVSSGDGWSRIASRAGATMDELLTANGASVDRPLHEGDTVCLPPGTSLATNPPTTSTKTDLPDDAAPTYTVARGDSWYRIADRAGIRLSSLLSANDAAQDDPLLAGDVIHLPSEARTPDGSPTTRPGLAALPVQGPCWYADTWGAAREGNRRHVGTDIIATEGRYVYAVTNGVLTDRDWDQPTRISGNAWTLTAADGTYYYYAHLKGFVPGLSVGSTVRAGQIIGWVGATGNASGPNLHLEVHPGGGEAANPYPLLSPGGGCNRGTPYRQPSGWIPD